MTISSKLDFVLWAAVAALTLAVLPAAAAAAAPDVLCAPGQGAAAGAAADPSPVAVQTARLATLTPAEAGGWTLTLHGTTGSVDLAPPGAGEAGAVPQGLFLGEAEAAQAVLASPEGGEWRLEIGAPTHGPIPGTVSYSVRPLGDAKAPALPDRLEDARLTVDVADVSCSDGKATCHWIVQQCAEWFDRPEICQKLGPVVSDKNFGEVSWGRYYCGCDTKCYPRRPPQNCADAGDMITFNCQNEYGAQGCPDGMVCYWQGTDTKNTNCAAKCCGGFCGPFKKC